MKIWSSFKKGPFFLYLFRLLPGFAPRLLWLENKNTCKGPWVPHPYQVSSKSIKGSGEEVENVKTLRWTNDWQQTDTHRPMPDKMIPMTCSAKCSGKLYDYLNKRLKGSVSLTCVQWTLWLLVSFLANQIAWLTYLWNQSEKQSLQPNRPYIRHNL